MFLYINYPDFLSGGWTDGIECSTIQEVLERILAPWKYFSRVAFPCLEWFVIYRNIFIYGKHLLPSFPHVRLVHNPLSRLPALPLHKIVMSALGDGGLAIHLNQISVNRVYGKNFCWKTKSRTFFLDTLQCTLCSLGSMFSFQPNKLRHILKLTSC